MNYRVKRGDVEFGPYSLADLQQYVQSGQVSPQDLAQSEGMSEWVPVSQVLGDIPIPSQASLAIDPGPGDPYSRPFVPLPPNLHWGLLLLIDVLTRAYFNIIWALIQANWARKLSGKNTPMVLIAMYPAGVICGGIAVGVGSTMENGSVLSALGGLLILGGLICMIAGTFSIRNAMEEYYNSVENIGLSLSGAMTFFFGVVYLQYHINSIARSRKAALLA
jgi:hypothetical protein